MCDRVADAGITHLFDRGRQKPKLARAKFIDDCHFRTEDADAINMIICTGLHHADALALFQNAVHDPYQNDDAEIAVVPTVHEHGF